MWQLYCMYGDTNKWTELYESYDEVCSRIADMKSELMELSSFLLIINDPDGTQVQSVSK
jgi:hypothetical protein